MQKDTQKTCYAYFGTTPNIKTTKTNSLVHKVQHRSIPSIRICKKTFKKHIMHTLIIPLSIKNTKKD
jgi:hypothetical protein